MINLNYHQKINEVGKNCGVLLFNIPFYYYFKQFSILGEMNKMQIPSQIKSKIKVNAIVSTVLLILLCIFTTITFFYAFYLILDFIDEMVNIVDGSVSVNSRYDFIKVPILIFFTIAISIALRVCIIVTGNNTNKFLNSNESQTLTDSQRYELSKYVGASFGFIPFYLIIKLLSSYNLICSTLSQFKSFYIVIYVLYTLSFISNIMISVFPYAISSTSTTPLVILSISSVLSSAGSILPIICIVVGVKMSKLIVEKNQSTY